MGLLADGVRNLCLMVVLTEETVVMEEAYLRAVTGM